MSEKIIAELKGELKKARRLWWRALWSGDRIALDEASFNVSEIERRIIVTRAYGGRSDFAHLMDPTL